MSSVLIKSFSVGKGDMHYVRHRNGDLTVIDCCIGARGREIVGELRGRMAGANSVVRFVSTHPEADHIGGLDALSKQMSLSSFWCVSNKIHVGDSDDEKRYVALRDGNKAKDIGKGVSILRDQRYTGINFLWPDVGHREFALALNAANGGGSANNISPIMRYAESEGVTALWMGDMSDGFLSKIAKDVEWEPVDILFAPHHGRDRVPDSILGELKPRLIVLGEADKEDLEYYKKYPEICQNAAGDILFQSYGGWIYVYTTHPLNKSAADFLKPCESPSDYSESEVFRGCFKTHALKKNEKKI